MKIVKITSKVTSVKTKCFFGHFNTFTIQQKFSSEKIAIFAEVTYDSDETFLGWD